MAMLLKGADAARALTEQLHEQAEELKYNEEHGITPQQIKKAKNLNVFATNEASGEAVLSSVDLPMPGAPPTSTSDPATPPPPSTRSSSPIPVENRISFPTVTSRSFFGVLRATPRTAFWRAGAFLSSNSTIEFQAPHAGHCPCQRGVSLPHSRQTNTVLDFIFRSSSLQPFGQRAAHRRAQPLLVSFVL